MWVTFLRPLGGALHHTPNNIAAGAFARGQSSEKYLPPPTPCPASCKKKTELSAGRGRKTVSLVSLPYSLSSHLRPLKWASRGGKKVFWSGPALSQASSCSGRLSELSQPQDLQNFASRFLGPGKMGERRLVIGSKSITTQTFTSQLATI